MLMVTVLVIVMCGPRSKRCPDDDGVSLCSHRVFHVGWYQQKTSYTIALHSALIQALAISHSQCPGKNRNSRIGTVPVMFVITGRDKKRVGKSLAGDVTATFQYGIFCSIGILFL